ncbi:MAG: LapA family protein [Atribacterota bacterium]
MQLQLIVAIIVAILAVVFALQNAVPIIVSFLTWRFESSLALVLLITVALGVIISLLVSVPSKIKRIKLISSQKKKIQELESNLQREGGSKTREETGIKVEEEIERDEPELPLE